MFVIVVVPDTKTTITALFCVLWIERFICYLGCSLSNIMDVFNVTKKHIDSISLLHRLMNGHPSQLRTVFAVDCCTVAGTK